ncbi:hypothetical protein KFK09_007331 [Dendrobium nobile]|uniref:protein-serine/threonine phosphatase n=1 Tax=Dendrobium nobile TaxID=94219 RepID=A0A8T3BTT1_DENNO|nr:hypothetical protein KFK09_007331 [Dendrobium nobile]
MLAVVSSPVFSPPRISLKTSPGNIALGLTQQHLSAALVDGLPSPGSSASPFWRSQRGASSLGIFKKELCASPSPTLDSAPTYLSRSSASSVSCSSPVAASNLCGSSPLLKRKRPTRLDIPMSGLLAYEPPVDSDGRREVEAESARYSVYCKRGRKRIEMEDRHSAALDLCGDPQMAFFGIFDGHGGSKASHFCSENLGDHILEETIIGKEEKLGINIEEAVRNGYLRTDAEFLKENVKGGTCCVTAVVRNGDLIVSNAGDCRAVMSFSGAAKALTSDHRPSREDEKDRIESLAFFGIFDGHGGSKASHFCSENLGDHIFEETIIGKEEKLGINIEEAVRNGYLRTDAEFLNENVKGGTCCVTAVVRNGDLIVSNAGDCRAVMSFSGAAKALTSDHRPSRDDEKDRIESLGGYVDCCRGVWRLQGSLAVSRGIGDSHLKQWVIAEPETSIIKIEPECEFLILASDGLWEKVSNQEAIDIARPLCMDPQRPSPLSACKKLVNLSVSRGSMDDISVLIVQLGHYLKQV